MHLTEGPKWFNDPDEVKSFAHILDDAHQVDDWLYYYDKPWKWDDDYLIWIEFGKPTTDSTNWQLFTVALDSKVTVP